jgi:hypothetical protein
MLSDLAQQRSTFDEPLLLGCLGVFLLLVILILVWVFVLAPRRARRQLAEYRERGYGEIAVDAPELVAALQALTPIMPEGTLRFGEGRRSTLSALVSRSGSHSRYLVQAAESTDDQSDAGTVWRTLFLDTKPPGVESECSARLTAINVGQGREERFGFRPATVTGASAEFTSLYSAFSREGRPLRLAPRLQEALVEAAQLLTPSSRFNTRFTPGGWGISVSNAYLQQRALRTFVDAAERISAAL